MSNIELGKRVSELYRRINNMIRVGVVIDVNYQTARARVQIGEISTGFLPWTVPSTTTWFPLQQGEQVIVLAPNGDLGFGIIIPSLYQTAKPAPSSDDSEIAILANIKQTGDIEQTGNINTTGKIESDGTITAKGEITGNGKKLSAHTHNFQYVGAGQGATPQSGTTQKPT